MMTGKANTAPKVFFIGFNKCGTKTVTNFFRSNSYRSMHCRARPVIYDYLPRRLWLTKTVSAARIIDENLKNNRPVLHGLPPYRVYSDLTNVRDGKVIEACRHFKRLHAEYPQSYFVLNVRPVEKWIRSREAHDEGRFLKRYCQYLQLDREEVKALWRKMFAEHCAEVTGHFKDSPKFTVFDIESDSPHKLVDFLAADFKLDPAAWSHRGATVPAV